MNNNYTIKFLPLALLLGGCGQTGPLYLPTEKPPITVSPEQKKELEREKALIQKEKAQEEATGESGEKAIPESSDDEPVKETPPDLTKEN